jgi:hypothetical protein
MAVRHSVEGRSSAWRRVEGPGPRVAAGVGPGVSRGHDGTMLGPMPRPETWTLAHSVNLSFSTPLAGGFCGAVSPKQSTKHGPGTQVAGSQARLASRPESRAI